MLCLICSPNIGSFEPSSHKSKIDLVPYQPKIVVNAMSHFWTSSGYLMPDFRKLSTILRFAQQQFACFKRVIVTLWQPVTILGWVFTPADSRSALFINSFNCQPYIIAFCQLLTGSSTGCIATKTKGRLSLFVLQQTLIREVRICYLEH